MRTLPFALVAIFTLQIGPVNARPSGEFSTVDSGDGLLRCHYHRAEDETLCADVLVWAGEAWAAQVDEVGFFAPLPDGERGGSDALDIYLTTSAGGPGIAWVECDASLGGDCNDADPDDGLSASSAFVVIDPRTSDANFPHYVHHEFNHVLQYGIDFNEPFLSVWEGTAVAAERWTDPTWDTSASDLADYQATPWASAVLQDGYYLDSEYGLWSWYEYGAVAWIWWMDHTYGTGDGTVIPQIWVAMSQEGWGLEPDVLDAWNELAVGGWTYGMLDFAVERARMGTDAGPEWAAFAGTEGLALREADLGELPATFVPEWPPYPLGTTYVDVAVTAGDEISVEVGGDLSTGWGLVAVEATTETTELAGPAPLVHTAAEDGTLTVGVVNLGPVDLDANDALETASFELLVERIEDEIPLEEPEREELDEEEDGCTCRPAWTEENPPAVAMLLLAAVVIRRRGGAA